MVGVLGWLEEVELPGLFVWMWRVESMVFFESMPAAFPWSESV
jgi:hypothetical protein